MSTQDSMDSLPGLTPLERRRHRLIHDIKYIEGDWTEMPFKVIDELALHLEYKFGKLNFTESKWQYITLDGNSTTQCPTHYELVDTPNIPLLAARYSYKSDLQIVVIGLPDDEEPDHHRPVIVLESSIQDEQIDDSQELYSQSIWRPAHRRRRRTTKIPQIVRVISTQDPLSTTSELRITAKRRDQVRNDHNGRPCKRRKVILRLPPSMLASIPSKSHAVRESRRTESVLSSDAPVNRPVKLDELLNSPSADLPYLQSMTAPVSDFDLAHQLVRNNDPLSWADGQRSKATSSPSDDRIGTRERDLTYSPELTSESPQTDDIEEVVRQFPHKLRQESLAFSDYQSETTGHDSSAVHMSPIFKSSTIPSRSTIPLEQDMILVSNDNRATSKHQLNEAGRIPHPTPTTPAFKSTDSLSRTSISTIPSPHIDNPAQYLSKTDPVLSPSQPFANVRIAFRLPNWTLQDEQPFRRCSTARYFLDAAIEAEIAEEYTRLFVIQVDTNPKVRMRANDEESFRARIVMPLSEVLRVKGQGARVLVQVARYVPLESEA